VDLVQPTKELADAVNQAIKEKWAKIGVLSSTDKSFSLSKRITITAVEVKMGNQSSDTTNCENLLWQGVPLKLEAEILGVNQRLCRIGFHVASFVRAKTFVNPWVAYSCRFARFNGC
jgi:hypothetical protein